MKMKIIFDTQDPISIFYIPLHQVFILGMDRIAVLPDIRPFSKPDIQWVPNTGY